jgi:hypothetical protein
VRVIAMGYEGLAGMINPSWFAVADDLHVTAKNVATLDAMVQMMAGGASGRKDYYPRYGLLGDRRFDRNSLQNTSID